MISFEMERKLAQAGIIFKDFSEDDNIHTCHKPTFEELWGRLPDSIENELYILGLWKINQTTYISYGNDNETFIERESYKSNKSLSDLAAEMLIELKNRGMM